MEHLRKQIDELYHQLYKVFILFANNYVNDIELAKDLVQEAYLLIIGKINTKATIRNIKNYFYTTLRNLCINHIKHLEVQAKHINSYQESHHLPDIEQEIIKSEIKYIMAEAIRQLSPQQQNVIKLSMREFKNEEIAERMSIKLETVKTTKARAYARLREILKNIK